VQVALFKIINEIFDTRFEFQTHDEARQFFIALQNHIKNMNFMAFESDHYRKASAKIQEMIDHKRKR